MARTRAANRLHDAYGAWMLVWSWGPALAALSLARHVHTWWAFALALLVVTSRQNALFVVAHESFHKNLFRNAALNRFAGSWLAAYPTVIPWISGREGHLKHHRAVGTEADPDRYAYYWHGHERSAVARHWLAVATGVPFVMKALRIALHLPVPAPRAGIRRDESSGGGRADHLRLVVTHLVLLGLFSLTFGWMYYFAFWLWPAISLRLLVEEMREFLEHRGGHLHVYRAGPLGRFILGPFNFHLHGYHHAVASEPWFRLAQAAERAHARVTIHVQRSYERELFAFFAGRTAFASADGALAGARPPAAPLSVPDPR